VDQTLIFAPMGALALLTFLVLGLIPLRRIPAVMRGRLERDDFALGESAKVPADVSIVNRGYMNLLEAPLLFYVICLMSLYANRVGQPFLVTAWIYVGLRFGHSAVHLTYNNVLHRLTLFGVSNVALMALWVMFFARVG